jgi:succinate-acetate transporter protein
MSSDQVDVYDSAEKGGEVPKSQSLKIIRTKGGHIDDRDQPSLPVVHRSFANPAPLGLLSFATGMFLISILGVHARGIPVNNIMFGVLMCFGGVCQFISGIMEFIAGNTVLLFTFLSLSLSFVSAGTAF